MVSSGLQRQIAGRAMAQVEAMAAVGNKVYDLFEDAVIAAGARELADTLTCLRASVRRYAIRNGLAGSRGR